MKKQQQHPYLRQWGLCKNMKSEGLMDCKGIFISETMKVKVM